jgi:hypothetical protein
VHGYHGFAMEIIVHKHDRPSANREAVGGGCD